ncbi:MAG: DUF4249 family protein [Tunicatimonas sp.]
MVLMGCETTVEIDVPRYPAQLTVNSLFTPDSVWTVALSQNRYILDNDRFKGLPEAAVEVWQEGQLVTTLEYQGDNPFRRNSIYRATDVYPKANIPYTLQVTHPDYATLVASSQVPDAPQIVSASLDVQDVRQEGFFSSNEIAYGLTFRLDDLPEENFYSISLLLRWEGFGAIDIDGSSKILLEENVSFINIRSDDPVIDNAFDNYRNELLFKDVSFNGQQYQIKAYGVFDLGSLIYTRLFDEGVILNEEAYDREGNVIREAGDTTGMSTLHLVLRNTTEEYYNYNFTRDLQASVENNPFAQPVQVFDNVENGLGIFAGYNQQEQKITIR